MADPLGSDIRLFGDLVVNSRGDLDLAVGTDNLKQRIIHRLQTMEDEYYFGKFGSTVKAFIDYVGGDAIAQIKQATLAAIMAEPGVKSVPSLIVTQQDDGSILVDSVVEQITGNQTAIQTLVGGGA